MDTELNIRDLFRKEIKEAEIASKDIFQKQNKSIDDFSLQDKASNGWTALKLYCFDEFMDGTADIYKEIALQCKAHGMKHVYDIGCCDPFQGKIFTALGMKYTGIEMEKDSVNDAILYDGMDIIHATYPIPIQVEDKEHTVAVSNLCLGYLIQDAERGYEQLAKDFRYFCGSLGPDKFEVFEQKFGVLEVSGAYPIIWADKEKILEADVSALKRVDDKFEKLFHVTPPFRLKKKKEVEKGFKSFDKKCVVGRKEEMELSR